MEEINLSKEENHKGLLWAILVVVILVGLILGFFYFYSSEDEVEVDVDRAIKEVADSPTTEEIVPETNPFNEENSANTNPFEGFKNPFE